MNVLVLGSGAREHLIVEKLSNSEKVDKICCQNYQLFNQLFQKLIINYKKNPPF